MGKGRNTEGVSWNGAKFVLVSGGVISGIGKGLTASSIGVLLKSCGWRVTAIKIDPYINMDAGTMSPFEHGEVFVLDDGGEVDLDLGNYERFLDVVLQRDNNITTGKIYHAVIERERRGDYLGKTVQVIPHVTDEIKDWIIRVASAQPGGQAPEICVIELGGTVGDIESMSFIEALRQLKYEVGDENFCSVFVSLVPELGVVGEQKTKPTQHGVKNLSSMGLAPDLIVCRSERPLLPETKKKLGLFCQVPPEAVVSVHDVRNVYNIPLLLQQQGVCNLIIRSLHLVWRLPTLLERWDRMSKSLEHAKESVSIAVVGKYTGLSDAYLSVVKALTHAGMAVGRSVEVKWIESSMLEKPTSCPSASPRSSPMESTRDLELLEHEKAWSTLKSADGILVPGGFGSRGIEGMILAAQYARVSNVPYLGICLGMQIAAIEIARHELEKPNAHSEEIDPQADPLVVVYMPEVSKEQLGGTMRLGTRKTILNNSDCLTYWLYDATEIWERHRHRYEVNPDISSELERVGKCRFVGQDESGKRMEVLEIPTHPFFLGTQFHPEFTSRPGRPSPPFLGLILAAAKLELDCDAIQRTVQTIRAQDPWRQNLEPELNLD
uniref:CTP synthase n=1 Tax=Compsopogon caeruleus TaxID=31354 RepID=A0A7S1TII0_9RHOD|mmetsp:Transcript_9187/g.18689  ORF Transcript_9187/g.18689 Transcript_9187/m.18689 type:complete len:607 (+) Transcript_9187:1973-3793(+)